MSSSKRPWERKMMLGEISSSYVMRKFEILDLKYKFWCINIQFNRNMSLILFSCIFIYLNRYFDTMKLIELFDQILKYLLCWLKNISIKLWKANLVSWKCNDFIKSFFTKTILRYLFIVWVILSDPLREK